ncbi:hypothetical protein [Paenibacillus polymyxa]|uniref:Uncharacterized protein n=1 Tax=Paenibacillus polymyxa (strain SC2) TaxID=886882 RepID=A0A0D5ZCC0_PAEPS|nr:hypothetical protein [Paenibacillus polymyxa]AKA44385.1 hypothetical protein PPSC2_27550 [Paenibacillus polymyxa SC2]WPQ59658.1 hypothetical protein SKN87_28780 [Paenibacillus polymyxa]
MKRNQAPQEHPIVSLFTLYSMPISAMLLTMTMYVIKATTNLHMELNSVWSTFVLVAVVTMLNPLTFLIEIPMSILSERILSIPAFVFRFISKTMELLLLVWLIHQIDGAIEAVELSMYGQITFAFLLHLITAWMTYSTSQVKEQK